MVDKGEASSFDQTVASQVDWYHDFSRRCASDADCFAVPGVAASGSIGWCVKHEGRCANVRDLYRSLYTVAAPHHRFLTVPPAFTLPNSDANRSEERLLANLSWYVEWAAEDPRIDGLCPFEYGDGNPAQGLNLGASSLPTLWRALVDLGRTIVADKPGLKTDDCGSRVWRVENCSGVVADGAADDTTPLQACVSRCIADATCSTLHFDAGRYKITAPIVIRT